MRTVYGRTAGALIGALMMAATVLPGTAAAQRSCQAGAFQQRDMAGLYVSAQHQIRVEIYSCGGSYVRWANQYGTHEAIYYSTHRLDGGGVAASKMRESYESLDGAERIGYKPAEPGSIQVITVTPYAEILGVYRLQKIGPEPIY